MDLIALPQNEAALSAGQCASSSNSIPSTQAAQAPSREPAQIGLQERIDTLEQRSARFAATRSGCGRLPFSAAIRMNRRGRRPSPITQLDAKAKRRKSRTSRQSTRCACATGDRVHNTHEFAARVRSLHGGVDADKSGAWQTLRNRRARCSSARSIVGDGRDYALRWCLPRQGFYGSSAAPWTAILAMAVFSRIFSVGLRTTSMVARPAMSACVAIQGQARRARSTIHCAPPPDLQRRWCCSCKGCRALDPHSRPQLSDQHLRPIAAACSSAQGCLTRATPTPIGTPALVIVKALRSML